MEISDGSYSLSDIEDYFEYTIKKHETLADNPPIGIYVIKIENRTTFTIQTSLLCVTLTPETMKLLESTKNKITKNENGENVPHY